MFGTSMPETTVQKYSNLLISEHDIGRPGKRLFVALKVTQTRVSED